MKKSSMFGILCLLASAPSWAELPMPIQQCHSMDLYGIYKMCDELPSKHREGHQKKEDQPLVIPTVYVVGSPLLYNWPTPFTTLTTFGDSRREPAQINQKLHELHLRLNEKQSRGEIADSFYREELRYLAQIEDEKLTYAATNGGYLTVAQENSLLKQLRQIEDELN